MLDERDYNMQETVTAQRENHTMDAATRMEEAVYPHVEPQQKKKSKKSNGFRAVVATGLICSLVGGGIGVAPLYYTAKQLKLQGAAVDIYLGFTDEALLQEEYAAVCDKLVVNVGGYVTDEINPADYDVIMTCGPHIMMKVLANKVKGTAAQLYVSMENRMGCGVGACLVCSCKTSSGNKKVCKDGPVFKAEEVFGNE